jgi:hypothetical protein
VTRRHAQRHRRKPHCRRRTDYPVTPLREPETDWAKAHIRPSWPHERKARADQSKRFVVRVPTDQITHTPDGSTRGAMPAGSRHLGDPPAPAAATMRGTRPPRHVVRTPALPSHRLSPVVGRESARRLSGNPRPAAASTPLAASYHDPAITPADGRDLVAPTAPVDGAVRDTGGPGSGVGLPLTNDGTIRTTPMASFEGPSDPRGFQTHAGSSASQARRVGRRALRRQPYECE